MTLPHDYPRIRPVKPPHVADMIRIAAETNLSHWSARSYLEELKNADSILLRLVTENDSMIGFVVGRLVANAQIETLLDAEVYNIAVTEQEQNKGRGQLLFDAFAKVCSERRVTQIWLEVRESNENAISFYKKNGFERVQTRSHFYEDPREHAILMRLFLK